MAGRTMSTVTICSVPSGPGDLDVDLAGVGLLLARAVGGAAAPAPPSLASFAFWPAPGRARSRALSRALSGLTAPARRRRPRAGSTRSVLRLRDVALQLALDEMRELAVAGVGEVHAVGVAQAARPCR